MNRSPSQLKAEAAHPSPLALTDEEEVYREPTRLGTPDGFATGRKPVASKDGATTVLERRIKVKHWYIVLRMLLL